MRNLAAKIMAFVMGGSVALAVSCGSDDDAGSSQIVSGTNCPGTQPLDGDDCDMAVSTDDCQYTAALCQCTDLGWDCTAQAACPVIQPTDGADCSDMGQDCDYGETACQCTNQGWDCQVPTACPTTQPATAVACEDPGQTCSYDQAICQCTQQNGWSCQPIAEIVCPDAEPAAGDACNFALTDLSCTYTTDTCVCAGGGGGGGGGTYTWICGVCPDAQPEGTCTDTGLSCDYSGTECTCQGFGGGGTEPSWQCATAGG